MPESLRDVIEDIQRKLRAKNNAGYLEVVRVLKGLGWDPDKAKTVEERHSDNRVQFLLFSKANKRGVQIQVIGQLNGPTDVNQLKHIRREAPFWVITDGRVWQLYYISDRAMAVEDLLSIQDLSVENAERCAVTLQNYISKRNIVSGRANKAASQHVEQARTERIAKESLTPAKALLYQIPYPNLPKALITVLSEKNISLTYKQALNVIRGQSINADNNPGVPIQVALAHSYGLAQDRTLKEPFLSLPEAICEEMKVQGYSVTRKVAEQFVHSRQPRQTALPQNALIKGFVFQGRQYRVDSWNKLPEAVEAVLKAIHGQRNPLPAEKYTDWPNDPDEMKKRAELLLNRYGLQIGKIKFIEVDAKLS